MATTLGWRRLGLALATGAVALACQTIAQLERPKELAVTDAGTDAVAPPPASLR